MAITSGSSESLVSGIWMVIWSMFDCTYFSRRFACSFSDIGACSCVLSVRFPIPLYGRLIPTLFGIFPSCGGLC